MSPAKLVGGLRGQIVDRLRGEILSGRFDVGEPICQQDLVDRFRVSRTPIREAIIQLTYEGVLVAGPYGGVTVANHAHDSIRDSLVQLRRTIEVCALRLGFDHFDDSDFTAWDDIVRKMGKMPVRGETMPRWRSKILRFIGRSGHAIVLSIWSIIVTQVRVHFREAHLAYDDLLDVYREHAVIVDMFRARDNRAAVDLLNIA